MQGQAQGIVEAAQTGICVPPENPGALAAAVERLYGDEAERERLGRNGRSYIVSHMSRKQTAIGYLKVIERIVEAAQPPRVPTHSGVRSEV